MKILKIIMKLIEPFCKSIESIKRKQVEQEFSGKGAGSKKKPEFDFSKDLRFSESIYGRTKTKSIRYERTS